MDETNEILLEARDELKRLEHIIYVSLKYTRTVDVITNALKRMVSTYDLIIEAFLEQAIEDGKLSVLPKSPALRSKTLLDIRSDDEELKKYLAFYTFLKLMLNSPFTKKREYRRHVALVVEFDRCRAEANIDNLTNAERFLHKFLTYSWHTLVGKPKED